MQFSLVIMYISMFGLGADSHHSNIAYKLSLFIAAAKGPADMYIWIVIGDESVMLGESSENETNGEFSDPPHTDFVHFVCFLPPALLTY